jgi:non-lysosomal glucosylceramidase
MKTEKNRALEQAQNKNETSDMSRRKFLQATGATAAGLMVGPATFPVMAGPFDNEYLKIIPADKKLDPAWLRSLYERGEPEWYSGEDLRYIGMPVGGICCGHVYLSADGRLWHWDIFNEGIHTSTKGTHYAKPMASDTGIDLGFTIFVKGTGKEMSRPLDATGFPKVRFRGAYPMGFVDYADDEFPVKVSLEAFSPFTTIDVDNSSLPLTVMRYTVGTARGQALYLACHNLCVAQPFMGGRRER